MLKYESTRVPVPVSIVDKPEREPTHICERDPAILMDKFVAKLKRWAKNIQEKVRAENMDTISKLTRTRMLQWCNQAPVLVFNSGRYDFNLTREHFVERLADIRLRVPKNANTIMFLLTDDFHFLEAWVKAFGCAAGKSRFLYEWFDSVNKLNYAEFPE